jgi:hypothetical protein
LTVKQQLLQDVGAIITSNRSNVGRWLKPRNTIDAGHSVDKYVRYESKEG